MTIWERIISDEKIRENLEWHGRKEIESKREILLKNEIDFQRRKYDGRD